MATTTNFGWETPDDTDLVKDGAAAIRTLGSAIDTSLVDLKGGTTGQVLSKTSNTDMDFTWVTSDDANAIQNAIVDAKGDLIAASAADTPARLAVGNNGETLVADSSATTGLRWQGSMAAGRNFAQNGGFDIWQRGTSFSNPATNAYTADRWCTLNGGSATITLSRQATGDTTNLPFIQYCMRFQRNSGQTNTGALYLTQSLESVNSIPLAGRTITFSFYARAGANFSAVSNNLSVTLSSGTGTDQNVNGGFTGVVNVINANVATLTTTWQRFSFTGTIGSTATQIGYYFFYTPTGTAGANDYFEVTGVQLELGSVATAFTRQGGNIAGELAACQRYYYVAVDGANKSISMAAAYGANNAFGVIPFKVSMRTTPTLVQTTGTNYYTLVGNNTSDSFDSFQAIADAHSEACRLDVTSGIASTQLGAYWFISASASARLAFSAEL